MTQENRQASSNKAPERMGAFELLELLGRGGMAETFVAVRRGDGGFEQRVCVKRILPELARDPNMVRMFLDEARNTASLRHSNIVQVIDFGSVDGQHYLALELVDGLDLRRLQEAMPEPRRGLPADLTAHLAVELAAALEYAHNAPNASGQRGLVHRDISPSNVLISEGGDVKLTDFGVAKAAGQARATAAGVVRGTVEYMAPEYGMGGPYDARCDQYTLGVLLFEALCGQRPYSGHSQGEVLHRARQGFHKPLSSTRPDAPPVLIETIQRMIRPDPSQRFGSMAEVTRALLDVAPGPRGRVALGDLVAQTRRHTTVRLKAVGNDAGTADTMGFGQTMVSPQASPAQPPHAQAHDATLPMGPTSASLAHHAKATPNAPSTPATPTTPLSTPATSLPTSPMRLVITVALITAVVSLVLLLTMRALRSPTPNADTLTTPPAITPPAPTNAAQQAPALAPTSDPLPAGLSPPELLSPTDEHATDTADSHPNRPRTPQQPDTNPDSDRATPQRPTTSGDLIHRQSQDLIKPKDW